MMWLIYIIMALGAVLFLCGIHLRYYLDPNTYAGERFGEEMIYWFLAFVTECVAGVLYLLYRYI